MKHIFRGDITADFILDSTLPVELYDIISCNFCLECVAKTKEGVFLLCRKTSKSFKARRISNKSCIIAGKFLV